MPYESGPLKGLFYAKGNGAKLVRGDSAAGKQSAGSTQSIPAVPSVAGRPVPNRGKGVHPAHGK